MDPLFGCLAGALIVVATFALSLGISVGVNNFTDNKAPFADGACRIDTRRA
jgi:hypothetical protein